MKKMIIAIVLSLAIVGLLPFIIHWIYYLEPPCSFFNVEYDVADILSYYGSVLIFIGTSALGIATYFQNKKAQEKSEEVNRLQLELQRKSMAMAEAQYQKEQEGKKEIPKFELKLAGYSGVYGHLNLEIKNVSAMIISSLSPISVAVKDQHGEIACADKMKFKQRSLASGESTIFETDMPELVKREGTGFICQVKYYDNVELIWEFSCEDEKFSTHYYRATLAIPSTKEFSKQDWMIEKVG